MQTITATETITYHVHEADELADEFLSIAAAVAYKPWRNGSTVTIERVIDRKYFDAGDELIHAESFERIVSTGEVEALVALEALQEAARQAESEAARTELLAELLG